MTNKGVCVHVDITDARLCCAMSDHSSCGHPGARGLQARKEADGIPFLSYVLLELCFPSIWSDF